MMNACLIMGHKNPKQIIRLAQRLKACDTNDIFIHIDSTMSKNDTDMIMNYCEITNGIYYCSNRLHGVLDKRSLVDIVFIMISAAHINEKKSGKHYDYYLLFSGQDYPIKDVNYINEELVKNYPKPYIDCTPYDKSNWLYHKFVYCKASLKYHDWISYRFKKGIIRSSLRLTSILFALGLSFIGRDSYTKLKKKGVSLYGGSAWWILPDLIIDTITERYQNKDIVSELILNESTTPEETYFQTMSMLSPFSKLVEVNPKNMVLQNCKTWAYFFDEGKDFKGHPYIFTIKEYDKLKNSDFWYARKFDSNVDVEILDALDSLVNYV